MAKGVKTGGRVAGTPNKATAEIKDLARVHGADAIKRLAELMTGAESEQAQVSAAKELLDRGYGKVSQPLSGDTDNPVRVISTIERILIDANPKN